MVIQVRPQSRVLKRKTKRLLKLTNLKLLTLVLMDVIWFPWATQSFRNYRFTKSVWHTGSAYFCNSSVIKRGEGNWYRRAVLCDLPSLQYEEICLLFYCIEPAWTFLLLQYSCCLLTSTQFWPLPGIPGSLNTLSISCLLIVTM